MKSIVQILIISCFLLMLVLPGMQMLRPIIEEERLYGFESPTEQTFPWPTLSGFLAESFQKDFISWLNAHFGFRGHLVRTDNQLNFSIFGEISSSYNSRIVVGKGNRLYEKLYIDSANGMYIQPRKQLQFVARQLLRLQNALAARGKAFIILITPSKATVYREFVPSRFLRDPEHSASEQSMNGFVGMLRELKLNLLDTRELLNAWKSGSKFELFAKGGTHWTEYIACEVGREFVKSLNDLSARKLQMPRCRPTVVNSVPGPFDRDLGDLSNLWSKTAFYSPLPYVNVPSVPHPGDKLPRVFLVGGSFLWSVLAHFERQGIYSSRDFFYYYERRFRWPENTETKIKKASLNWSGDVFTNDIFVLEINEAYLHHVGMGFVRDALRALKRDKDADRKSADAATETISRTP